MYKINTENVKDLNKEEFSRYQRLNGQLSIKKTKVLVIGAGGIGSSVLMYLASMGIGCIGIIDSDTIDISNLHRQVIHQTQNQFKSKVESAKQFIQNLNPNVQVNTFNENIDTSNALNIIKDYDYVLDGCDNPKTRYIVNDACKVLVSGASVKWEGQVSIYNYKDGPCYRCLYPECPKANQTMSCSTNGVIGMAPGVTGQIIVTQLLKLILEYPKILSKQMLVFDLLNDYYKSKLNRDCIVCGIDKQKFDLSKFDYEDFVGSKCGGQKKVTEFELSWEEFCKVDHRHVLVDCRPQVLQNIVNLDHEEVVSFPFDEIPFLSQDEIVKRLKLEHQDDPVYVFCRSGVKSVASTIELRQKGFKAFNVIGGLKKYKIFSKKDFPII